MQYSPWYLQKGNETKAVKLVDGRRQGKLVVAALDGVDDRDKAASLGGWKIRISREQLPAAEAGEYYWADLVGLIVENQDGIVLGRVDHLLETGANDVLVVKGDGQERLIPFLQGQTVLQIDLDSGRMLVDWDSDF